MKTIENKKTKLFNGISKNKIREIEEKYKNLSLGSIQSMEDELSSMLIELVENETDLNEVDIDENYMEIMDVFSNYNWDSRYGLDDGIKLIDVIEKLNN